VPVTTVLPEERFLFKPIPSTPGFYRAVARYGCARARPALASFLREKKKHHCRAHAAGVLG
jgi:hypothetical protein